VLEFFWNFAARRTAGCAPPAPRSYWSRQSHSDKYSAMRYSFSECVLDTERRELQHAGRSVSLRAKSMQVLIYLIEHSDRVVTKEELFAQLWTGRVVGDATLNSCLKEVRRAIGDTGRTQDIVRTLHGQGYRFVAPLLAPAGARAAARGDAAVPDATAVAQQPAMAAAGSTSGAKATTVAAATGAREHKQVSVLACAVADAGARAAVLGAEGMDEAMRSFFATARDVVGRYGGRISEWRGDGFTALFGAPVSLEDHARRAVLAALDLRDAAASPLKLGLHTGEVVVGSLDEHAQPYTALCPTTQLATDIRDAAPAATVAVSERCFRLVETEVIARVLPHVRVDGAPSDVRAIERLAARRGGVPRRARRRTPLVGRAQELAIIRARLDLAANGSGQAVCLSGDPGIGKSRLLEELRTGLGTHPIRILESRCLPYHETTPYFALAGLVRECCGVAGDAASGEAARALADVAQRAGIDAPEDHRLLLELLDFAVEARTEFEPGSSCGRVFALVNRLLLQEAATQPCVVAIEDLHWMDATSGVWLAGFVQQLPAAALLLLVTFRPAYRAEWTSHSTVTRLALPRLNDADSAAIVASVLGDRAPAEAFQRRVVNHAQGNPFFLEELTWNLLESRADAVPTTIQAVLAARIDQLAPGDKLLLQTAAVIDTPVPHALLCAASAGVAEDVEAGLRRLESAELLHPVERPGGLAHHFRHALTQNVAYASLLSSTRRELHKRIAELYEERFGNVATHQPELVARHYAEAGVSRKALEYWRLAGERAANRSANQEAAAHFERALGIAATLPDDAEPDGNAAASRSHEQERVELELYLAMGPPLMASRSFSSRDVERTYGEAHKRAARLKDERRLFAAEWGMWLHCAHRGRIGDALRLSAELLEIARRLRDPDLELQAHHSAWTNHLWHGDIAVCREHALAGVALYDPRRHQAHARLYGNHDPGVCALGTTGISAAFLGLPDTAMAFAERGAALATSLNHPYSRLITTLDFMLIGSMRREIDVVRAAAEEAYEISSRLGVPNYLAVANVFLGWASATDGNVDAGIRQLEAGLAGCREVGAERNLGSYLLLLAEACLHGGRPMQGLAALAEAQEVVERTGELRWSPEILRMRGELLLASGEEPAAAAELFDQARLLAAAQGARAFELRAATSLACTMTRHAREARALLEPVYAGFSEGLDTADLRRARELLSRLPAGPALLRDS
jgi:DNA-binding winged helix-turn-helix (wHTH) protein